jgi:sugar phosphate permease
VAASAAGWIRTDFGDYRLAFVWAGVACVVAALLSLGVGRARPEAEPSPS